MTPEKIAAEFSLDVINEALRILNGDNLKNEHSNNN
jgi:hypothetical protein